MTRTAFSLLTSLALATFVACTPQPGSDFAEPGMQGNGVYMGTVRVVGSLPVSTQVVLQREEGKDLTLAGPLLGEIERLAGARVAIRGAMESGALQADSYQIQSVDGAPVEMGLVERAPSGGLQLRKADGSVLLLGGGASHLQPGQKVWVQGPRMLQVQTFGVIAR